MNYRAFIDDEDTPFRIEYYHNPKRWVNNITDSENPIMKVENGQKFGMKSKMKHTITLGFWNYQEKKKYFLLMDSIELKA